MIASPALPAAGINRNTRALPALRSDWLTIDSRTERQLLAQVVPTAALFNYYDSSDQRCGRWDAFFNQVPLVRYAVAAEMNMTQQARIFRASLQKLGTEFQPPHSAQVSAAWNVINGLVFLFRRVDADARFFSLCPKEIEYAAALRHAITDVLAAQYDTVTHCRNSLAEKYPPPFSPGGAADPRNALVSAELNPAWWGKPAPRQPPVDLDPSLFVQELTSATWATHATLTQLVASAQDWYARRSANVTDLPPHFALYLAFVRQFGGAQQAMNKIPGRHRDFFYRRLLHLSPEGPTPDTTFVAFTAAKGGWSDLPAGTALVAGKDAAGNPIVYRTQASTTVTGSALAQIATVFLQEPATSDLTGFYTAPNAASADGIGAPLAPGDSWATFGEAQRPAPARRTMLNGQIGFALSSPVLHLEEGARIITLDFALAPGATAASPAPQSVTVQPLWQVDYSSAKGWTSVPAGQITCTLRYEDPAPGTITPVQMTIVVTLLGGDPGCVNYDPKTLGPGFDSRTPVLRVRYLNPLAAFRAIDPSVTTDAADQIATAFASAPVNTLTVSVEVSNLQDLVLAGPSGRLVPGKPLPLFGSPPAANATFAVGKVELFRKHLTSLALTLTWQGLPTDPIRFPHGLRDYYEDYLAVLPNPSPQMFRNDQYLTHFSALSNRAWKAIDANDQPPSSGRFLFIWAPPSAPDGKLMNVSIWEADPNLLNGIAPVYDLAGPLDYSPATTTGFVRLELIAPDYLFGQQLYPAVVATIALDNSLSIVAASQSTGSKKPLPPPDSATAYTLLRVPAPKSFFAGMWAKIVSADPDYTFNSRLFPALATAGGFPPEVAAALGAAGVSPDTAFTTLGSLKGKTFTNRDSFDKLIASTIGVDPTDKDKGPAAQNALDTTSYWMALLIYPKPPPMPAGLKGTPRAPMVPTASAVSMNYTASTVIDFAGEGTASRAPGWDVFWQIAPLAVFPSPLKPAPIFPPLATGGALYLGFRDVQPPETLALLFIMEPVPVPVDTPANHDSGDPPVWSYLAGDAWKEAPNTVVDGTHDFLRTGLVRIDLPDDANTTHTTMPSNLVWLRVEVKDPAKHLRTIQALTHAAEVAWSPPAPTATFDMAAISAAHFAQPLPTTSITGLQTPDPAIQAVIQPLPSSGGAPAESVEDFATRVSERLRHKERAVAAPDYERLILRRFPAVFSARAIWPADETAAGTVTIVVLPTLRAPPAAAPPGFVAGDLRAIKQSIAANASPCTNLRVVNPTYESIKIRVQVKFPADRSLTFHCARLTADLQAFISPWIYRQAEVKDPVASFHASDFSAFIRGLSYVRDVGVCQIFSGQDRDLQHPLESVAPSSPLALLISAPAHVILPLP